MVAELLVTAAGIAAIALAARFFFAPRAAAAAAVTDGVREAGIVVRGGYEPAVVRASAGVPLRLVFDRQEDGDCSSRVVFPSLGINRWLAPHARTAVDVPTTAPGAFEFACGMNMLHGSLVLEPGNEPVGPTAPAPTPAAEEVVVVDEAAEARARKAETDDLARRVVLGALLTLPVFVSVMAVEVFEAGWVPEWIMDRWVQLALIAPVMCGSAGRSTAPGGSPWPIGRRT